MQFIILKSLANKLIIYLKGKQDIKKCGIKSLFRTRINTIKDGILDVFTSNMGGEVDS